LFLYRKYRRGVLLNHIEVLKRIKAGVAVNNALQSTFDRGWILINERLKYCKKGRKNFSTTR